MQYELYLFSKYFLFLFQQARYGNDYDLNIFTQLLLEYFLNPVTLVYMVNKSIDMLNEEAIRSSRYRGVRGSTGGDFYNKTRLMPLTVSEEPQPQQMLFVHVATIIIKDQWKPYIHPLLNNKYNPELNPGIVFMRTMHKWFKTLLIDRPNLINNKGKFFNVLCIYLSIISPESANEVTFLDEFISLGSMAIVNKSKLIQSKFFGNVENYGGKSEDQDFEDDLILEKLVRGGRMDSDSFSSWLKVFLLLYTDTFRDIITFIADEDTKSGLDYLAIYELSDIFKVEGNQIIKGWIEMSLLTKISRSSKAEEREFIYYIHLLNASPDWIDPFGYDRHFNRKLMRVIDTIGMKFPNSISSFPNSITGNFANDVLEFINHNANRTIENFISILRASHIDMMKDFSQIPKISNFKVETQHDKQYFHRGEARNPFSRQKKNQSYYADWSKPKGDKENVLLFMIFYYFSALIDWLMLSKDVRRNLKYPKTNIRFMANSSNIVIFPFVLMMMYYFLFW